VKDPCCRVCDFVLFGFRVLRRLLLVLFVFVGLYWFCLMVGVLVAFWTSWCFCLGYVWDCVCFSCVWRTVSLGWGTCDGGLTYHVVLVGCLCVGFVLCLDRMCLWLV